jgi:hypothetical protein
MCRKAGSMFAKLAAAAAGFDANHFHRGIAQKLMKESDGVRTAADAGEKMRGEAFFCGEDLFTGFAADDGLKIADHGGIGMRSKHRAEQIMRVADIGDPVPHGFVDGVLQSAAAGIDADDLRAEHAHARDVERLARHVFRAHVDDAFKAEMRGDSGGSDAVLAGAGFRNDARLAHFHSQQTLANGVVDFVCAGVEQVFALEVNAWTAEMRGEARSKLQRRRAASKIL